MAPPILSLDRSKSIRHVVDCDLIDPIEQAQMMFWPEVLSAESRAEQLALLDIAMILKNATDEIKRMTKELTEGGVS